MKRKLVLLFATIPLVGCSTHAERAQDYEIYMQAYNSYIAHFDSQKPTVSVEVDETGRLKKFDVNIPQQVPAPQQIKDNENIALINGLTPWVAQAFTTWVDRKYNYESNKEMWRAVGGSMGQGITVGGDATISGSGNKFNMTAAEGSSVSNTFSSPSDRSDASGSGSILNPMYLQAPISSQVGGTNTPSYGK